MSGSGSWRTVVGIGFIWPVILTVGIQFMPESPRWLASRGRLDEAQRALAVARGVKASEADGNHHLRREAEEIRASVEYERSIRGGWLDCFRVENKTLYRTILGVCSPFGLIDSVETHHPSQACPCNRCSNSRAQTTFSIMARRSLLPLVSRTPS